LDVTSLTPGGTPRVLDEPGIVLETNEEDTVVKRGTAIGEDTGRVVRPVGSINGNRDGLFSEGSQKS
jgi:hypothetical protein